MKNKQYLTIAIAALLVFAVGGTYAFFQVLGGNTETRNVTVQTNTTDSLSFNVSKDIEINASRENFYENAGNLTDTTVATARLVPNSKTHTASDNYNVYVVIDANNFVYTTPNHTPEILLTITDPNGNRTGNITGLTGTNGVYDITTRTGAFLVASNYEISADTAAGTTQEWTMTVTLVNLDTDQNLNTGKILTGSIYVTKEDMTTYSLAELNAIRTSHINEVTGEEESNITYNSITAEVTATSGSEGLSTYYFGIEEQTESTGYLKLANQVIDGIEYYESSVPSYTFTGLKDNTNYTIYAFVEDGAGFKSNIYETTVKTNEYILPQVNNVTTEVLSLSSIGVTATSQAGDNTVSKYLFDCGDGNGWSAPQNSNTYTCSNLSYNTNYNIEVKVLDTYGKYSVEYVKPSEITAYEVTYSCTNCTASKVSEYILPGASSTATITPSSNYNLTNATVSGCTLSNGVATVSNISQNTTCSIEAAPNTVTLTYDYNGATGGNGTASKSVTIGSTYGELPTPTKTGYTFKGWEGASKNIFNQEAILLSINGATYSNGYYNYNTGQAYSLYKDPGMPVTFKPNTQYTITIRGYIESSNQSIYVHYDGESSDTSLGSVTGSTLNTHVFRTAANKTVTKMYFSYGSGAIIHIAYMQVEEGSESTTFESYYTTENSIVNKTTDHSLKAVWSANKYTVTYNANGGSGTMANQTFTYGVSQNLRANTFTKSGYTFGGWNGLIYENADEINRNNDNYSGSAEFVRHEDLSPYFDKYGVDTTYHLELDLKSENITNSNKIEVYFQTSSGTEYNFTTGYPGLVTVSDSSWTHLSFDFTVHKSREDLSTTHLAFYGTYGTGNYPVVKNVKLSIVPQLTDQQVVSNLTAENNGIIKLNARWFKAINLNLTSRSVASPSNTSFDNTTKRTFNVNRYYVGLSYNNYYYAGNASVSGITSTGFSLTANADYGIALPVRGTAGKIYRTTFNQSAAQDNTCHQGMIFYDSSGNVLTNKLIKVSGYTSLDAMAPTNTYYTVPVIVGRDSVVQTITNLSFGELE